MGKKFSLSLSLSVNVMCVSQSDIFGEKSEEKWHFFY